MNRRHVGRVYCVSAVCVCVHLYTLRVMWCLHARSCRTRGGMKTTGYKMYSNKTTRGGAEPHVQVQLRVQRSGASGRLSAGMKSTFKSWFFTCCLLSGCDGVYRHRNQSVCLQESSSLLLSFIKDVSVYLQGTFSSLCVWQRHIGFYFEFLNTSFKCQLN